MPDFGSHRTQVVIARAFIVAIVAITYWLSLSVEKQSVFAMGVWCFSGFASLFPLVFAAVYWRRLTAAGAAASVLTVVAAWCYFFHHSGHGANRAYTFDLQLAGETYSMMPVAPMFAASVFSLVVVSLLTRPPSEATLAKFFD